jgi:hypothetical protein
MLESPIGIPLNTVSGVDIGGGVDIEGGVDGGVDFGGVPFPSRLSAVELTRFTGEVVIPLISDGISEASTYSQS